jgi:hypothetical protein
MKKLMLFSLIGIVLLSCSQKKSELASDTKQDTDKIQVNSVLARDLYSNASEKIIKIAQYRFQAANVKKSQAIIEASVRKYSAYISSSTLKLENPLMEDHIVIRVPSEYFEDLLKEIDTQAVYINERKITADDVAKEFVDLESRLKTKREVEQRYAEILRSKAGTIEELLKAEQKIGELHEEIEATISRISYLHDQVRYSTINLEFYQTVSQDVAVISETPGFTDRFSNALATGLAGAVEILIGLTYLWPLFALLILFLFWRKKAWSVLKKVQSKAAN